MDEVRPRNWSKLRTRLTGRKSGALLRLNLLEPRLVEPLTTVIIPLDDRVLFISLLNCAEFSSRFAKVAQPLDAISGIQFLARGGGGGEARFLGTVGIKGRSEVWQGRLGSFTQFVRWIMGPMGHIPVVLSKRQAQRPFAETLQLLDSYSIAWKEWFGWSKLHSSDNSFE